MRTAPVHRLQQLPFPAPILPKTDIWYDRTYDDETGRSLDVYQLFPSMAGQFEWIVLDNGAPSDSKRNHGRIQSHAMRATAASRKESGTWGKLNQRQYPPAPPAASVTFTDRSPTGNGSCQHCTPENDCHTPSHHHVLPLESTVCPPMPLSGFERLTAETGVNILDLSNLTTIQVGHIATSVLRERIHLADLIKSRKLSYLTHVPAKFGSSPCLDDAVRCVAAKARRVLAGFEQGGRSTELSSYGKALRGIQAAINLPGECLDPDVLCAVEILGLYEILEPSSPGAWSHHVSGASSFIRAKGPMNFKTTFETLLLYSVTGAIACQSILKNEACFLEDEPWQRLLQSVVVIDKNFSRRGPIGIGLACMLTRMPRLLRDVTRIVHEPTNVDQHYHYNLVTRLHEYRTNLLKLSMELGTLELGSRGTLASDLDEREELRGGFYSLMIMGCRMLSAVSMDMVGLLENEALNYSDQMVRLESQAKFSDGRTGLFLHQKLGIAQATLNTRQLWRENSSHGNVVEWTGFKAWFDAMPT